MLNTKYILIILSVVMIWSLNGFAQADDTDYKIVDSNEVPGVLSMLATAAQSNFEKIKTWQGQIARETLSTTRGEDAARLLTKFTNAEPSDSLNEIQRLYNTTIEFKIDVENNRFFSFSGRAEPYIYVDTEKGKAYTSSWSPEELIFLVTSEYEIKMMPLNETKNHVVLNRLALKSWSGTTRITDPRKLFYIGERTSWLTLSMASQVLQIPNVERAAGAVIKRKSTDDNTTYRIEISEPGKDRPYMAFVLSSEAGFNRTFIENWYDDGSLMSNTTTEFVNLQGVFLPKKWEISQYFPDGGLRRHEDCTIEHQQINISIPDSAFSEHTHLRDGDRFRDNIARKKFEYKGGKLIEDEKKSK